MPVISELNNLSDVLKWEQEKRYSREALTIAMLTVLALGEVIGRKLLDIPTTGTADAGNTGDGTMTGVAGGSQTQLGDYTLTCIEGGGSGAITTPATGTADGGNAGANTMGGVSAGAAVKAGTYTITCTDATNAGAEVFQVTDPDGLLLAPATVAVAYVNAQILFTIADPGADAQVGDSFTVLASAADGNSGLFAIAAPDGTALPNATVGVAYANAQLNGTINDGATDFAVGDIFTVAVAKGDGTAVALDLTAVDGTQIAAGFVIAAYDATAAAVAGVAVVRDAVIDADNLVWPAGITADQTAAALDQLAARGIVTSEAA
jgi:hypothetical protein